MHYLVQLAVPAGLAIGLVSTVRPRYAAVVVGVAVATALASFGVVVGLAGAGAESRAVGEAVRAPRRPPPTPWSPLGALRRHLRLGPAVAVPDLWSLPRAPRP